MIDTVTLFNEAVAASKAQRDALTQPTTTADIRERVERALICIGNTPSTSETMDDACWTADETARAAKHLAHAMLDLLDHLERAA